MTTETLRAAIEESIQSDKERMEADLIAQEKKTHEETKRYLDQEERDRWMRHSYTVKLMNQLDMLRAAILSDAQAMCINPEVEDIIIRGRLVEARTITALKHFAATGNYVNQ